MSPAHVVQPHDAGRVSPRAISRRLQWHNAGQNVSTVEDRPWTVLVSIEFDNAQDAIHFERYLKSGSGRALAKRHFP